MASKSKTKAVDDNQADDNMVDAYQAGIDVSRTDPDTKPAEFDPFSDLSKLRISQDFVNEANVKKVLATVPVRKPHKHDFIRVRPEPEFREHLALIQLGTDKEYYLVMPNMTRELIGEWFPFRVYTCINRQGTVFLWPVRLPGSDGKDLEWWKSAHDAAVQAMKKWTRITPNKDMAAYEIREAGNPMSEPTWPEESFKDLLRIGFKIKVVDRVDHEVVRQLRGLV